MPLGPSPPLPGLAGERGLLVELHVHVFAALLVILIADAVRKRRSSQEEPGSGFLNLGRVRTAVLYVLLISTGAFCIRILLYMFGG